MEDEEGKFDLLKKKRKISRMSMHVPADPVKPRPCWQPPIGVINQNFL